MNPYTGLTQPVNIFQPQIPGLQQPMQTMQYQQGPQLLRVKGIESARMYQTQPNSEIPLFDEDNDIFYIKKTDASNYPVVRAFRFTEIKEDEKVNADQFVTKDELNSIVEKLREEIQNGKQFVQPTNEFKSNNSASNNKYYRNNNASKANGSTDSGEQQS